MSHYFSCDWGTTSFRLRRVDASTGEVTLEHREASGVKAISAGCATGDSGCREAAFATFLRSQLMRAMRDGRTSGDPPSVVISGMASSSVGWRELPYARLPVGLDGTSFRRETFDLELGDHGRAEIHLISGVRTGSDVMRGEETELLGLFAQDRYARIAEDGIVVLPGTHSKHVHLRNRQMTDFRTYMTGELFDILSAHSLLRASVQAGEGVASTNLSDPDSRDAFALAVREGATHGLAGSLFQTRVRTLLQAVPPVVNRWFLSGLLVGSEAADLAARRSEAPILLAAAGPVSDAYRFALVGLGLESRLTVVPPQEMTLASVRGHRVLLAREMKAGPPAPT